MENFTTIKKKVMAKTPAWKEQNVRKRKRTRICVLYMKGFVPRFLS
jgi:hypothetical protein